MMMSLITSWVVEKCEKWNKMNELVNHLAHFAPSADCEATVRFGERETLHGRHIDPFWWMTQSTLEPIYFRRPTKSSHAAMTKSYRSESSSSSCSSFCFFFRKTCTKTKREGMKHSAPAVSLLNWNGNRSVNWFKSSLSGDNGSYSCLDQLPCRHHVHRSVSHRNRIEEKPHKIIAYAFCVWRRRGLTIETMVFLTWFRADN